MFRKPWPCVENLFFMFPLTTVLTINGHYGELVQSAVPSLCWALVDLLGQYQDPCRCWQNIIDTASCLACTSVQPRFSGSAHPRDSFRLAAKMASRWFRRQLSEFLWNSALRLVFQIPPAFALALQRCSFSSGSQPELFFLAGFMSSFSSCSFSLGSQALFSFLGTLVRHFDSCSFALRRLRGTLACDLVLSSKDDRPKHSSSSCWWWVGIHNAGTTTAHHHLDQAVHTVQGLKNIHKIYAGSLQRHISKAVRSSGSESLACQK